MKNLSPQAKESIVKKVLSSDGRTLSEIAKAHNIGVSTLGRWLRSYRKNGIISHKDKDYTSTKLSSQIKLEHLLSTTSLNDKEVGAYCRKNGIYSFQLTEWKKEFMAEKKETSQELNIAELKALRDENKKLKQEVRRKDSALAEATALLILKKKAALIWGEIEED